MCSNSDKKSTEQEVRVIFRRLNPKHLNRRIDARVTCEVFLDTQLSKKKYCLKLIHFMKRP